MRAVCFLHTAFCYVRFYGSRIAFDGKLCMPAVGHTFSAARKYAKRRRDTFVCVPDPADDQRGSGQTDTNEKEFLRFPLWKPQDCGRKTFLSLCTISDAAGDT